MPAGRIIAGAMSGTSADGVDVALVRIEGRGLEMSGRLLAHHQRAYDTALKQRIVHVRSAASVGLGELAHVGREIALVYAAAVNEALVSAGLRAGDLAAVAAHGQTLFHDPPVTIQWIDPAVLAAAVGCAVVSDFRRADCAAGGQGAPLVPFADWLLFRHPTRSRILLNIGGIANITCLRAGCGIEDVVAFDTGPGNCISDHLVRHLDPDGPGVDIGGARAMRGRSSLPILGRELQADYFHRPPPKSTDGPAMVALFEAAAAGESVGADDLLATACSLTVQTVLDAVTEYSGVRPDELIVSGGGVHNQAIMGGLRQAGLAVLTTDELGVPSGAKEAMAFALLGAATLDGVPGNVPSATGARRSVVLGSITPTS